MTSPFAPLPTILGGFACIVVGAAAHFSTWSDKGQGRAPSRHYKTQRIDVIVEHLNVRDVAARDSWCWLWLPDPHAHRIPEIAAAFGFRFSAKGFTWIKTLESLARGPRMISTADIGSVLIMGGGLTTRKNSESCWLLRRGKPQILSRGVREVIVAPRREHSRKPDESYARIEAFRRASRFRSCQGRCATSSRPRRRAMASIPRQAP